MSPAGLHSRALELLQAVAAERPELASLAGKLERELRPIRPGPGFTTLYWHGQQFYFTGQQAAAVAVLWRARKSLAPAVRQEYVFSAISSEAKRFRDLFRGNPAFGMAIVPGPIKGCYRLSSGPDDTGDERGGDA